MSFFGIIFYTKILLPERSGRMGKGPVPADPGRDEPHLGWEPVITRPDPMSAEEWQAQLECEPAGDADPHAP
jgi:hypothetical protein